ncbi:phage tail sheath subtilisin-like domain-containing protein [Metaclostridioides mangenotii]|uniref:Phage tail sheath protein n=1 Tax=Metaclostridioides mangenotii TaxID=1540 RepID=A0ABS4EBT3_9FIRM|nr:phage tail sheath subtilisin-like domain-containing protein [Clostridioides mangenotii]MBP1855408.1 hypothetical protein [Clostridioides mangenotii]
MALGGGVFVKQDKVLPGTYITTISASRAPSMLSERGVAAMPILLDWGVEGEIIEVNIEKVEKDSLKLFGYDLAHEKLKGLRDLFRNIKTAYLYRLNAGEKAKNTMSTAKYSGVRGNDIKIVVSQNVDDITKFEVKTFIDTTKVDTQLVKDVAELKDNDFVVWNREVALELTAGMPLTGGASGDTTGVEYQDFLKKIDTYAFNILGTTSTEKTVQDLFIAFTKRMRDEEGVKFQTVLYRREDANYEGIISVENKVLDKNWEESSLVYWLAGKSAGCEINDSALNKTYDGEFTIDVSYNQDELKDALLSGKFIFHRESNEVKTLKDINTLTTFTEIKNDSFSYNQTIRVLDQEAIDASKIYNAKYIGSRGKLSSLVIAYWNDLVDLNKEYDRLDAIENFNAQDIVVLEGEDKRSMVSTMAIQPVNAPEKLYMTIVVN